MDEIKHIRDCQQGNKKSFEFIFELYRRKAYLAALAMTGNPEDALDASQEAFIKAYRNIGKFEIERSFYPWFYSILKNCCWALLAKKKKEESSMPERSDSRLDPMLLAEQDETNSKLLVAINKLKNGEREILYLKYFQELRYEQIAEILSIPIGTVMSRLYNARSRLKDQLTSWLDKDVQNEV